jgi:hypothetical protein
MPARDFFHDAVRNALTKDGWTITDDPYVIEYKEVKLFADLAAERTLAAQRDERRIVVEIKGFSGPSLMHELELALGQFEIYRAFLEEVAPERELYLAVNESIHKTFFSRAAIQLLVQRFETSFSCG